MERAARCPDGDTGYKGEALRKTAKGDDLPGHGAPRHGPPHRGAANAKTGGVRIVEQTREISLV